MHAWESIQKALEYIESDIGDDIDIETLASKVALSTFYFQRLFSRLIKKPVREYIRYRRLARACDDLKNSDARILDIAIKYGFDSHQTFSKVFKQAYGMTPLEYKQHPVFLNQFDMPDLLLSYTMVDEGVPLISDGLVLEINRTKLESPILFLGVDGFVPIKGQMPLGEATGIDIPGKIWETFHSIKHNIPRKKGGREIGIAYLGKAPEGSFTYFAGAEADYDHDDGKTFSHIELPAGDYVVCGFEAENFEQLVTIAINKAIKFFGAWLEKHNIKTGRYSPEIYYDSTPVASYMELWMPSSAGK